MGQLTASDFQIFDPNAAGTIEPGPFALYAVSLDQILPTQMNEGLAEVGSKIAGWDLLTPSEVQSTLLTDVEPVVIGPGGQLYLLNGHHTFTSLSESIYGPGNPTVFVNVVANFSNLTTDQFWTQMLADNLLLPVDNGVPQTVNPANGAPIPTSLTALTDDPYRGLEHSILKNKDSVLFPNAGNLTGAVGASIPGLDKMNGFYADFIWAEAYRNADGGLGLSYLSPGDVALSTQWNLNPNSTTTMPGVGTVKVSQLPGFILNQDIAIATSISNATLATGTLGGDGTFDGITSFNFGPVTLGTPQSGFVMQLGADAGHRVTLSGANTYTGGTTILAGTLVVANDAALGAAAPATYTIDPNNIAASVEAANGIIFNSLDEGAGTLRIGSSFTTNRPIAVDGETATIDLNSQTLTLTGSLVSLGANGDGIGDETGVSDLSINDSGSGGKLILAPTSGSNAGFFGNWIITNGTLQVSSDAALGNTTGPSDEIGQIVLDGGTLQAGASFASVRSLSLTSGSTFDTNGLTTSFAGSLTDIQRTMTVKNSSTTAAGAVTFGSFDVGATATFALSGGTKGETVTFTNGIDRVGNATLFIDPSSTTSLGTTEKVLSTTPPTVTNGIVPAWMITDNGGGAGANPYDFLTYGANGFVKATYGKSSVVGAAATDTVEQTAKVTLTAAAQAYALKVDSGDTITATGQTLTLGDGTNAAGLILSNSVITGGTIAFRGSEATIFAKGNSNTISGALTGTGGLTLSGSGTLVLSAVSTLSGAVNIDSGTLSLTSANALANVSGVDLSNVKSSPSNAILNLTASQTFATLDSDGTNSAITFNNGARLTVGNSANLDSTLSASITETGAATAGALTKNGTGLLDLSGMSSGKLSLAAGSTIAVNGGDLRVIAKSFATATGISLAAGSELQFAENGGDVFAGNVTGAGGVRLIGGTLKLTGTAQTYGGGTFVEAGSNLLLTTSNVSTGNANIGVADGQVVFDQTTGGTYGGVISDALQMGVGPLMPGTLIKDDSTGGNSGNVTLSQAQAFSGLTYVEAGTLTLGAVNTLSESAGVVLGRVGGGAIASLALGADNELAALSDDASNTTTVQLNGHALTLAPAAGTTSTYDGTIVDGAAPGGRVIEAGAGTVVLGGANTFTGGATIESGTLELANSEGAGTGGVTFAGSANLKIDFGDVPANTIFGLPRSRYDWYLARDRLLRDRWRPARGRERASGRGERPDLRPAARSECIVCRRVFPPRGGRRRNRRGHHRAGRAATDGERRFADLDRPCGRRPCGFHGQRPCRRRQRPGDFHGRRQQYGRRRGRGWPVDLHRRPERARGRHDHLVALHRRKCVRDRRRQQRDARSGAADRRGVDQQHRRQPRPQHRDGELRVQRGADRVHAGRHHRPRRHARQPAAGRRDRLHRDLHGRRQHRHQHRVGQHHRRLLAGGERQSGTRRQHRRLRRRYGDADGRGLDQQHRREPRPQHRDGELRLQRSADGVHPG